jgi:molybdopterin-guanine dinucleotide biosynthesis protein A
MLTVVIQAGGESRRMGAKKALLPFMGEPLIVRVSGRLKSIADEILITAKHKSDFDFLDLPVIEDIIPGIGALGGLYTALYAAHFPYVAVVACDMPFASAGLIEFQRAVLEREDVDVVVPETAQGFEPLHALYRKATCLPAIEAAICKRQFRMISWFSKVKVRVLGETEIKAKDPNGHAFINVNTPDELIQAEMLAEREVDEGFD